MIASSGESGPFALAIETSGAVGSVAVGRVNVSGLGQLLGSQLFTRPRAHAIEFFPAIASLCREHAITPLQLSQVYVSSGPGSFTGLRIGITAARMLAFAAGAKIVALPTLQVIAQNALDADHPPARVAVLLDAKRGHVYAGTFERRERGANISTPLYVAIDEPKEVDPASFLAQLGRHCSVMGEGVLYHRQAVAESGLPVLPEAIYRPRADVAFALGVSAAMQGRFVEPRNLVPTYIRPPEAEEKWAAKHRSPAC